MTTTRPSTTFVNLAIKRDEPARHQRTNLLYNALTYVCTNPLSTYAWSQLGKISRYLNTTQCLQQRVSQQTSSRFPNTAHLKENQWANVSSKDGYGTSRAFKNAAELAMKSPDGRALFNIGGQTALVITHQSDIAQVLYHNSKNISRDAVFDVFSQIYSSHSVFAIKKGDAWRRKRGTLLEWLFTETQLNQLAEPMQKIIDEFIESEIKPVLSKENKKDDEKKRDIDLGEFSTRLTMDLIARTRLGTRSLAKDSEKFGHVYEDAFTQIINIENIVQAKIASIAHYLLVTLKVHNIEIAKANVLQTFRKYLLEPNRDLITTTDNLLKTVLTEEKELFKDPTLTLDSDEIASQGAFLLLGGHETTSRLLQFSLMLLAAHPEALAKLREEINTYRATKNSNQWDRSDLRHLPYLQSVLNETLRLYPPAPTIGRGVDHSFVLAKLNRFNDPSSLEEYKIRMEDRDRSQDITLSSGYFMPDLIIIPQFAVHRSPIEYKQPDDFIPERFDPKRVDLRPLGQKQIDSAIFFPFGLGDRECVGKKFSLQEISFALLNIVTQFDMKLPPGMTYPFPVVHRGTIKSPEPVKVRFIPLEKPMKYISSEPKLLANSSLRA